MMIIATITIAFFFIPALKTVTEQLANKEAFLHSSLYWSQTDADSIAIFRSMERKREQRGLIFPKPFVGQDY